MARKTKVERKYPGLVLSRGQMPQALLDDITAWIHKGRRDAYKAIGITHDVYEEWMHRGSLNEDGYVDFWLAVTKAQEEFENACLDGIRKHADKVWTAYAWLLERTMPERYARGQDRVVNVVHHKAPDFVRRVNIIDVTNELDRRLTDGAKNEDNEEAGTSKDEPTTGAGSDGADT